MAYMSGSDQLSIQGLIKGDSVFVRFSALADGTDFTETWSNGQNYVGFGAGIEAPTDKSGYQWQKLNNVSGDFVDRLDNADSIHKIYISKAKNGGTALLHSKSGYNGAENYSSIPVRESNTSSKHPGTFEIAHPVMIEGESGYSAKHPLTVGIAEDRYAKKADISGPTYIGWSEELNTEKVIYACKLGAMNITDRLSGETFNYGTNITHLSLELIHPVIYGAHSCGFLYFTDTAGENHFFYIYDISFARLTFMGYSLTDSRTYTIKTDTITQWLQ